MKLDLWLWVFSRQYRVHRWVATVKEIQVCGGRLFNNLGEACKDYLQCIKEGIDREKLHFTIILPTGKAKSITIRQEDEQVVAYGDFEGLPDVLDYAKEVLGNSVESDIKL